MLLIHKRIREIREENKLTQKVFADKIGITRGLYAMIEAGKSTPTINIVSQIANVFCKSYDWLIDGTSTPKNSAISQLVVTVDTQGSENIIFVPIKASAGYLNGYADPEYIHQLPAYRIPGLNNGTFRMFEIKGQSMQSTLENGDKIIGEWVLPIDIKNGNVYIIVSKNEGICVKRCINRLKSDNHLILQSDNKEFPDIVLDAEDVLEVWSVKLRMTSKINNPSINRITENAEKLNDHSETNKRIDDLEARLTSRLSFIEKKILTKP